MLNAIRGGASAKTAARAVGVPEGTLYRWLKEAENPKAPPFLREFRESVTRAKAQFHLRLELQVSSAVPKNPMLAIRRLAHEGAVEGWGALAGEPSDESPPAPPRVDPSLLKVVVGSEELKRWARARVLQRAVDMGDMDAADADPDSDPLAGHYEVVIPPDMVKRT